MSFDRHQHAAKQRAMDLAHPMSHLIGERVCIPGSHGDNYGTVFAVRDDKYGVDPTAPVAYVNIESPVDGHGDKIDHEIIKTILVADIAERKGMREYNAQAYYVKNNGIAPLDITKF